MRRSEGYYLVTGFSGHGFMHGPHRPACSWRSSSSTASPTTLDVSMLDYQRFAEGRLVAEYNVG
ncbi:MAG: hypothetical protein M5U34_28185 [Chloroflexi bacterium]|nr:hypothetical protein [Chloroflexota bacterium]